MKRVLAVFLMALMVSAFGMSALAAAPLAETGDVYVDEVFQAEEELTSTELAEPEVPQISGSELAHSGGGGVLSLILIIGAAVALNAALGFIKNQKKRDLDIK